MSSQDQARGNGLIREKILGLQGCVLDRRQDRAERQTQDCAGREGEHTALSSLNLSLSPIAHTAGTALERRFMQ